ncbi:MAG: TDP-N-acetylfucosamine:lipid II N-acetylfucosaminyltransferase [Alphaproteobacteria bacterium]|nr:TDP-N-acetylfucosamine:lipid II N-acetylfucosaminyltransferase [Alphaproteobacteria bacterium]
MPRISVIIPCYNASSFLEECLVSVQQQTLQDIELVCVDDKSSDNTVDILKSFADKDQRIKIITKNTNEGAGKARNLGIDNATGDYVVFMDPDDYYPDDKVLEKLYTAVCENNVKIAGGNLIKLTPKGESKETRFTNYGVRSFKDAPFIYGYTLFIYSRDFLVKNKIYFPDYKRFQDPPFFVNAMILAEKYYTIPDDVYVYRVNYKHIDWTERKGIDTLNGVADILKLAKNHNIPALYLETLRIFWNNVSGTYEQCCSFDAVKAKVVEILNDVDFDILATHLKKKLPYKKCYCDIIKNNPELYSKWKNYIKWPSWISGLFRKERSQDGRRRIYFCGFKIASYTRKIKLTGYKFVHLCHNDKFIKPFVDFCNRNFDPKEHVFLCQNCFPQFEYPTGANVIPMRTLYQFDFSSKDIKKIICHSLFVGGIQSFLWKNKKLLKEKCLWMIWGGDLYNAPRDEKNDYIRKNFRGYISDTDGDIGVAIKKYDSHPAETYDAGYTFPITKEMIKNAKRIEHDYVAIQINNSADDSTLEMLDVLSKFKDENIKIKTILSYGKTEYKEQIIQKGRAIFGDKFEYLDSLMTPADYAQYMAQNDILILNQNRQQGLGNSFATLTLGGKLFIRSEITTYTHFNSKGIKVYDTNEIKDMNFEQLVEYPADIKKANQEKTQMFFEDSYLKNLWRPVFEN